MRVILRHRDLLCRPQPFKISSTLLRCFAVAISSFGPSSWTPRSNPFEARRPDALGYGTGITYHEHNTVSRVRMFDPQVTAIIWSL